MPRSSNSSTARSSCSLQSSEWQKKKREGSWQNIIFVARREGRKERRTGNRLTTEAFACLPCPACCCCCERGAARDKLHQRRRKRRKRRTLFLPVSLYGRFFCVSPFLPSSVAAAGKQKPGEKDSLSKKSITQEAPGRKEEKWQEGGKSAVPLASFTFLPKAVRPFLPSNQTPSFPLLSPNFYRSRRIKSRPFLLLLSNIHSARLFLPEPRSADRRSPFRLPSLFSPAAEAPRSFP